MMQKYKIDTADAVTARMALRDYIDSCRDHEIACHRLDMPDSVERWRERRQSAQRAYDALGLTKGEVIDHA